MAARLPAILGIALCTAPHLGSRAIAQTNLVWNLMLNGGPSSRLAATMAFDSGRNRTVLFGGSTGGAETWEWDGVAWMHRLVAGPSARTSPAMAFDSTRNRVVLFGGSSGSNETWEYDGSGWTRVTTNPPPGSGSACMAYDSARQRMVLLVPGSSASTWEFDGSQWSQITVSGLPSRNFAAMAYDSARARCVMFGGLGNSLYGDTWEWDGNTWMQVAAGGPAPRYLHTLAYDPDTARSILFGGWTNNPVAANDTWAWDGAAWTQLTVPGPTPRCLHSMAHDFHRHRTVIFGGDPTLAQTTGWRDVWELGATQPATAAQFGQGCGTPPMTLAGDPLNPPRTGARSTYVVDHLPLPFGCVMLGWSSTMAGAIALPLQLGPFGMPGCELLQSAELVFLPLTANTAGSGTLSLDIPPLGVLLGGSIYLQAWTIAPGVNPAQMVLSNGVHCTIGN